MSNQPDNHASTPGNASAAMAKPTLGQLFLAFLRIGAMGFGGPFALISLQERVIAHQKGWMSTADFVESSGMGSIAPGPISSNASAVVGYRLRGLAGGAVAYTAFHLPAVVLVLILAKSFKQIEAMPTVHGALKGVFAAVVGLLFGVGWKMLRTLVTDTKSAVLVLIPFLAMTFLGVNPVLIVLGTGGLGYLVLRPK